MKFVESNGMKIKLSTEDRKYLSSLQTIKEAIESKKAIAFDIYEEQ